MIQPRPPVKWHARPATQMWHKPTTVGVCCDSVAGGGAHLPPARQSKGKLRGEGGRRGRRPPSTPADDRRRLAQHGTRRRARQPAAAIACGRARASPSRWVATTRVRRRQPLGHW